MKHLVLLLFVLGLIASPVFADQRTVLLEEMYGEG
jgi:hypothetical protein